MPRRRVRTAESLRRAAGGKRTRSRYGHTRRREIAKQRSRSRSRRAHTRRFRKSRSRKGYGTRNSVRRIAAATTAQFFNTLVEKKYRDYNETRYTQVDDGVPGFNALGGGGIIVDRLVRQDFDFGTGTGNPHQKEAAVDGALITHTGGYCDLYLSNVRTESITGIGIVSNPYHAYDIRWRVMLVEWKLKATNLADSNIAGDEDEPVGHLSDLKVTPKNDEDELAVFKPPQVPQDQEVNGANVSENIAAQLTPTEPTWFRLLEDYTNKSTSRINRENVKKVWIDKTFRVKSDDKMGLGFLADYTGAEGEVPRPETRKVRLSIPALGNIWFTSRQEKNDNAKFRDPRVFSWIVLHDRTRANEEPIYTTGPQPQYAFGMRERHYYYDL